MDNTFIQGRITATKAAIIAAEDAELQIMTDQMQSYTLNTSQSVQTVTKLNIAVLRNHVDSLYNRCATLEARLTGNGVTIARPAW